MAAIRWNIQVPEVCQTKASLQSAEGRGPFSPTRDVKVNILYCQPQPCLGTLLFWLGYKIHPFFQNPPLLGLLTAFFCFLRASLYHFHNLAMADLSMYRPSDLLHTQEELSNYQPGGFHPVRLDDTFKDCRYKIRHKLGWGGYSTVWLAKDKMYANTKREILSVLY